MRTQFVAAIVLGTSLLTMSSLRAGLYNTAEPMEGPVVAESGTKALGFSQFEDNLSTLIGIGVEQPLGSKQSDSPKRKHYLARRDELLELARTGRITVQERVNLSAYLIRLRGKTSCCSRTWPPLISCSAGWSVLSLTCSR